MSISIIEKCQLKCDRCGVLSGLFDATDDWPDGWVEYYEEYDFCPHCALEFEQWMEGKPFSRPTEDWIEDVADNVLGIRLELEGVYGRSWSDRDTLTMAVNTLNTLYSVILNLKPYPEPDNGQTVKDFADEASGIIDGANQNLMDAEKLLDRLWQQIEKL